MNNIEVLKNIILDDIDFYKESEDSYMPILLKLLLDLVRETPIPDHHIEDLNAMIGIYIDDSDHFGIDSLTRLKLYIDKYDRDCLSLGLIVISDNIQKLKKYRGEGSIYE